MHTSTQFVVTSPVHGDFAGFADRAMANAMTHRLNSRLFDEVVYSTLVRVDFMVFVGQESALNRQYLAETFHVVEVENEKS